MNLIGDVKGKVAVMVDDMIDTAGEFCSKEKTNNYH
jgi:phosphoribosylpyrophosphate synthetase